MLKSFILNTILSFKVTRFLGQISQFEFLVMTEKNIFAYKLFFSLNISDFNLFLCENCIPLKKSPSLSQQPPLKVEVLSSPPPFLKIWLEAQTPCRKGGVPTMWMSASVITCNSLTGLIRYRPKKEVELDKFTGFTLQLWLLRL